MRRRHQFRSPQHKLVHVFHRSRDQWRERAKAYHEEIRKLKVRIRDVAASRDHWRAKYFERGGAGAADEPESGAPAGEPPGAEPLLPVLSATGRPGPGPASTEPAAARVEVAPADGQVQEWEWLGAAPSARGPPRAAAPTGERAGGHHYPLAIMVLALEWVCVANTSFRGTAQCFAVLAGVQSPGADWPSFWTIRNWVLRLGLYEVRRPKPRAEDWVFIVDSSIAVGLHKALVIVGVRLETMRQHGFNLRHQDVSTLELQVLRHCDGPAVQQSLEAAARAVGVPRLIVSDASGELRKALSLFQADHPGVAWNHDLTHRFALLLEKELGGQPWWQEFMTQVNQCRQQTQQTPWSHLQPPAPRAKARWHNVRPLVSWALKVLDYRRRKAPAGKDFVRHFGWLENYRQPLAEALQMITVLEETARQLKHEGLNEQQVQRCAQRVEPLSPSQRVRAFADKVLAFLREQLRAVKAGETLLNTSDVLESLFGKFKALLSRSPLHAITAGVLLIGALTSARTPAVIQQAMEATKTVNVQAWFATNGEPTLLAKRRAALSPKKGTDPA